MELKQFSQKFLPFYKGKRERRHGLTDEQFCILFFDEALQAFADKICEKQMEIIMKGIEDNYQVTLDSFDVTKLTLEPTQN